MRVTTSDVFPDVLVLEPDLFGDHRGYFLETYRSNSYQHSGIPSSFVQDNMSFSKRGILRGLHYQLGRPQGKLVWVAHGEVYDVAVDLRRGSSTFGKWVGITLSSVDHKQVYIPAGFAHGFCVTSETALLIYKCTDYYFPNEERGIRWDDPSLRIPWPVKAPIITEKDAQYPTMDEIPKKDLPQL